MLTLSLNAFKIQVMNNIQEVFFYLCLLSLLKRTIAHLDVMNAGNQCACSGFLY